MYPSLLLELYKNPANFGSLRNPTKSVRVVNPSCGDILSMDFRYEGKKLTKVAFTGESCAISRASASLLTDAVLGKTVAELKKLDVAYMKRLIGIEIAPARLPCLLLSLEGLKKTLI